MEHENLLKRYYYIWLWSADPTGGVMFYGICTLSPSNITWIQNFKAQFATRVSEKGFWTFVAKISTEARFPLLATVLGYKMKGWSHRSPGSSQPLSFHWIYDDEKGWFLNKSSRPVLLIVLVSLGDSQGRAVSYGRRKRLGLVRQGLFWSHECLGHFLEV